MTELKHDWYTDEDGDIDIFRLDYGIHNGPQCRRCHEAFCYHCDRGIWDEPCSSQQLELDLG